MKKKYVREQRRRYLKKVANNYFVEQRKFKSFQAWAKVIKSSSLQLAETFDKLHNHYASEVLFEVVAYP
jgi:hypothetical protein